VTPHTLILGIGSPFGDDRAGWAVAEALRASAWFRSLAPGSVGVACLDRPGAGLLAALEGVTHAVLIDAMRSGAPPGRVRVLAVEALVGSTAGLVSSHGFGLAGALKLAKAMGLLPPRLTILAIEAGAGDGLDALSAEVRAAVPRVLHRIEACVGGSGQDRVAP